MEGVENEMHAIRRLCAEGPHKNIVGVSKLGRLLKSPYYFIDMELCDLNLHDYIHRPAPPNPSESIPYFIHDAPPPLKAQQIWNIMKDIAGGIRYLHSLEMVHRDLKPANGIIHHLSSLFFPKSSTRGRIRPGNWQILASLPKLRRRLFVPQTSPEGLLVIARLNS